MKKGGHGARPGFAVKNREDSHRGFLAARSYFSPGTSALAWLQNLSSQLLPHFTSLHLKSVVISYTVHFAKRGCQGWTEEISLALLQRFPGISFVPPMDTESDLPEIQSLLFSSNRGIRAQS